MLLVHLTSKPTEDARRKIDSFLEEVMPRIAAGERQGR